MKKLILLAFIGIIAFACSQQSTEQQSATSTAAQTETKPVKRVQQPSELALLMRQIRDEFKVQRAELEAGRPFDESLVEKYSKILTAAPTTPNDTIGPFKGFAQHFLAQISEINNAEKPIEQFNQAVQTCVNCHTQYCQGPIPVIKKLSLTVPA